MQNEIKAGFYTFPNIGYYLGEVPYDILSIIKKEIKQIQENMEKSSSATAMLSGNMEKEFDLIESRSVIENHVLGLLRDYDFYFNYLNSINCLNSNVPMGLENLWVNFQKKHEFNPNHNHSGVMSFVIWIKIPYNNEDEKLSSPGRYSNSNQAANFQFLYTDILGQIRNIEIPVDKMHEGVICMFPNKLIHCVYPFYASDEYRISVAGNISLKVK